MKKINKIILLFTILNATYVYANTVSSSETSTITKEEIITKVMNYPIPDPIARCKKDFGYSDDEMKMLERECKRYLIMAILKTDGGTNMYSKDVDNLWHSFILFTKEYARFGKECAGHFIHHAPRTDHDAPLTKDESVQQFKSFLSRYEELFNEKPHAIWFLDMIENQQTKE